MNGTSYNPRNRPFNAVYRLAVSCRFDDHPFYQPSEMGGRILAGEPKDL